MLIIFIIFLFLVIGYLFVVHMKKMAHENNVKKERFYFPNFPKSFKAISLFFISDLHRRIIDTTIIKEVKGEADFVVIGGDLLEKGVDFAAVKENLHRLQEIGPVYFVWGNNDYEVDKVSLKNILNEENVKILDNRAEIFQSKAGEQWGLVGVEDMAMELDDLDQALSEVRHIPFKIVVSHNPKIMNQISDDDSIALVLSGHTHGGQIRFLGIGPYEIGKIKVIGKTMSLVSNGYGTTSIPLRLGARPETHIITIQHTDDKDSTMEP